LKNSILVGIHLKKSVFDTFLSGFAQTSGVGH
jgi:hypothetical protein